MLRDLSTVIEELQEALSGYGRAAAAGMQLSRVEVRLPMDFQPILRDGGCVMLADVSRASSDAAWIQAASHAHFTWQLVDPRELMP